MAGDQRTVVIRITMVPVFLDCFRYTWPLFGFLLLYMTIIFAEVSSDIFANIIVMYNKRKKGLDVYSMVTYYYDKDCTHCKVFEYFNQICNGCNVCQCYNRYIFVGVLGSPKPRIDKEVPVLGLITSNGIYQPTKLIKSL
jgi:hypothetical protein